MESFRINLALISLILFGLMLLLSGCIEHRFLYRFNLDGTCDFSYRARGDSLDIYQPEGSFPSEPFFRISTGTEVDSAGTEFYILEAQARFRPDSLPSTLGLREVPWTDVFLQHPARLIRTPGFFFSIFRFEGEFKGRQRTALEGDRWAYIPEECHRLESGEDSLLNVEERRNLEEKFAAGMLLWNTERYKRRIREIIDQSLALHPDISLPQVWIDSALVETDSLVDAHLASIDLEDLDLAGLEWWEELAPAVHQILQEDLNLVGDTTLQAEIARVAELLEMRHQVSEDLMDESFEVRVDLPGRVISSNAAAMDVGVLVWRFQGEDLTENDIQLRAWSLYIYGRRVAGALVLILAIFLGIKLRRPAGKEEVTAPPPTDDTIPPTGHG